MTYSPQRRVINLSIRRAPRRAAFFKRGLALGPAPAQFAEAVVDGGKPDIISLEEAAIPGQDTVVLRMFGVGMARGQGGTHPRGEIAMHGAKPSRHLMVSSETGIAATIWRR